MNTKDFSPAFLTSVAGIFLGAILISTASVGVTIFGWLLLLAGIGLNVFSTYVSIQNAKGAPLPALVAEGSISSSVEDEGAHTQAEPSADTESYEIIDTQRSTEKNKVAQMRTPRPRNR